MSFGALPGRGSLANWALYSTVAPSEFWWFEQSISNAVDGGAGGTYAPSSAIIIGGLGLTVTGIFTASGAIHLNAITEVSGNFYTYAYTSLGGDSSDQLNIAATTLATAPVTMQNNVVVGASGDPTRTFTVYSLTTFSRGVALNGDSAANGSFTCTGNVTIGDATSDQLNVVSSIRLPLRFGQSGYVLPRFQRTTTTSPQSATLEFVDWVIMAGAASLEIADYGENGAIMSVSNVSTGSVTVNNESAATIIVMGPATWVDLMRNNTLSLRWEIVRMGTLP